jgi:hypothetical protein
MTGFRGHTLFALLLFPFAASAATLNERSPAPVEVMIVGVSHMANPGHDLHNMTFDDVLTPNRQVEIVHLTEGLARFKPTKVAIEQEQAVADKQYATYLDGSLPPSRNERVQLGFRLAKLAGTKTIYGIDADGDFPYEPLKQYAEAHGFGPLLAEQNALTDKDIAEETRILADKGISATLRYLNTAAYLQAANGWYRTALRIGAGNTQPGVELVSAWQHRNLLICANLLQMSKLRRRPCLLATSMHRRDAGFPAGRAERLPALICSLPVRRLPQFDLVALRVHDPAEFSEVGIIGLVEDVAALVAEGLEQRGEVVDPVVDHEGRLARREVVTVGGADGPGGRAAGWGARVVCPVERGTAPRLDIDAQVAFVPGLQRSRVLCVKEDTADTCDSFHVSLRHAK